MQGEAIPVEVIEKLTWQMHEVPGASWMGHISVSSMCQEEQATSHRRPTLMCIVDTIDPLLSLPSLHLPSRPEWGFGSDIPHQAHQAACLAQPILAAS